MRWFLVIYDIFLFLFTVMFLKITSSGATGLDYNAHQAVSASVPVNPPGGPDLQNRYVSLLMLLNPFHMCSKIRIALVEDVRTCFSRWN